MPRAVPAAYKHSLSVRGLSPADLRRRYRFSKPLLANLAAGREVSSGSMARLAAVLRAHPPIPELVEILADEAENKKTASADQARAVEEVGNASARLQDTA